MHRNITLDILKLILSFFIVGLHASLFLDIDKTIGYLYINAISRIAVPIFLIISGYYFFKIETFFLYKRWVTRVLLLYIVWMIIYFPVWFKRDYSAYDTSFLFIVFNGYHHLWYLIGMVYASAVLFISRNLDQNWQILILIICALGGISIQYIGNYHLITDVNIDAKMNSLASYRNFLFFCLPFMYIGFLINKLNIKIKQSTCYLYFLLALGFLLLESSVNYFNTGASFDILISLFIISPFVFLLFIQNSIISHNKTLGLLSSGIYLIHPVVMLVFRYFHVFSNSIIKTVMTILVSLVLTYLLILINKRLKYLL